MADLTLYTMADPEILAGALQGIALVFDPSNTDVWVSDTSSGGLGIGVIAGVGLVISLIIVLAKAVLTQKLEVMSLVIILVAYIAAFVPKTTLQIERVQDGDIEVVDDIPYGVALPAALMSGMMWAVTDSFELAFSDPRMGTFSETGFMEPIKTLAKMRNITGQAGGNGYLKQNMQNYMSVCLTGMVGGAKPSFESDLKKKDISGAIFDPTRISSGIVELLTPDGTEDSSGFYSCKYGHGSTPSAAALMKSQIEQYTTTTPSPSQVLGLEADLSRLNVKSEFQPGVSAVNTIKSNIATIAGFASVNQDMAMADLVVGSLIREVGIKHLMSDPTAVAASVSMTEAMERFVVDSAGGASMFLRTMQASMDIMLFVWIAISPIVAMVMIMSGIAGLKMLAQYFMFGVWTQSWMPFALVINYYMQLKLSKTLQQGLIDPSDPNGLFAVGNQFDLYREMGVTIGTASQLLAYTPILSLAVLSGSYFALSQLGSAMSGKDGYFDEKKMASDAEVSTGGAHRSDSLTAKGFNGFQAMDIVQGDGGAGIKNIGDRLGSTSISAGSSAMVGAATEASKMATASQQAAINEMLGHNSSHMQSYMKAVKANYGEGASFKHEKADAMLNKLGVTNTQGMSAEDKSQLLAIASLKYNVGGGAGFLAKMISGLGADLSLQSSDTHSKTFKKGLEQLDAKDWSNSERNSFNKEMTQGRGKDFVEQGNAQVTDSHSRALSHGKNYQEQKSVADKATTAAQAASNVNGGVDIKNSDLIENLAAATNKGKLGVADESQVIASAGFDTSTPEGQRAKSKFEEVSKQQGGGWRGIVAGASALLKDNDLSARAAGANMMASLMDRAGGYSYADSDAMREQADVLTGLQRTHAKRMADGQGVRAEVGSNIQNIVAEVGAGKQAIKDKNDALANDVNYHQSNAVYGSAAADLEANQEATSAVTMGRGNTETSETSAVITNAQAHEMSKPGTGTMLQIGQQAGQIAGGIYDLGAGAIGKYMPGTGSNARLEDSSARIKSNEGVLNAGNALRNANTLEERTAAVANYEQVTGLKGGNLDSYKADFEGGREAATTRALSQAHADHKQAKLDDAYSQTLLDSGADELKAGTSTPIAAVRVFNEKDKLPGGAGTLNGGQIGEPYKDTIKPDREKRDGD